MVGTPFDSLACIDMHRFDHYDSRPPNESPGDPSAAKGRLHHSKTAITSQLGSNHLSRGAGFSATCQEAGSSWLADL